MALNYRVGAEVQVLPKMNLQTSPMDVLSKVGALSKDIVRKMETRVPNCGGISAGTGGTSFDLGWWFEDLEESKSARVILHEILIEEDWPVFHTCITSESGWLEKVEYPGG